MTSLDFEEFLWAKGYTEDQIDELYTYLISKKAFSDLQYNILYLVWKEYLAVSGMPAAVVSFVNTNLFSGIDNIIFQIN